MASAAVNSSGEVAALSVETAAKLAKAGMVVVVDSANGATAELPWQQGMKLPSVAQAANFSGGFKAAKIFRPGRMIAADLRKAETAGLAMQSGDVVELRR